MTEEVTIADETLLYRWVSRDEIVKDDNIGRFRPSSNAFQKTTGTDRMSVVLGDTLEDAGRNPMELADELKTAASLTVGFVRSCEQVVVRRPIAEEPAHGDVVGSDSKALRTKLACEAVCIEGDWEAARLAR